MSLKQRFCPALLVAMLAILTLVPTAVQAEMISDIGAYAWYRADKGVVTAAGSNVITSWEDQSGNDRDLAVSGNPTLTTNGIDSAATVTFDGNDGLYSTASNWGTPTSTTVMAVWKATGYNDQHPAGLTMLYSSKDSSGRQELWYTSEENLEQAPTIFSKYMMVPRFRQSRLTTRVSLMARAYLTNGL